MEYQLKGPYLIVKIGKELDHHQAQLIYQGIHQIQRDRGFKNLVFDFKETEFMDSSGVCMIISRYKELSLLGGRVNVSGTSTMINKLFYVSGLHKIIKMYPELEDVFYE